MGRAARANGGWRKHAPWQGIGHPHAGAYGLMAVLVNGTPEEGPRQTEVDLAVGPAGYQQELARIVVSGDGTAILPAPVNLRDGVALWYRASRADVNVAARTADIVHRSGPPGMAGVDAKIAAARARLLDPARERAQIDDPEAI